MSSPAASADATPPEKPARKFPPPCWTQEEALVLIDAYRERWNSLQRGYLRAVDWDAVAESVASRCPDAPARKTPAQCRHKMEKLRQRHRAEKQRAGSVPRYHSTWLYFDKMEAMDGGVAGGGEKKKSDDDASPYAGMMRSLLDPNVLKLKLKTRTDPDPDLGFGAGVHMNSMNTSVPSYGAVFPDFVRLRMSANRITGHPMKLYHGMSNEDDEGSRDEGYGFEQMNKSKRGRRNPVDEIVASIQSLGEGYLKIERAKMELTREMEAMRMEMEMKRNKMMLDSQRQIMDAFVKGMIQIRKSKKVKVSAASKLESTNAF